MTAAAEKPLADGTRRRGGATARKKLRPASHLAFLLRHDFVNSERTRESVTDPSALLEAFHRDGKHLRAVAFRMLGSLSEADDALQEAWLRISRSDTSQIANLSGWMTTVVARLCLDMLRARKSRREQSLEQEGPAPALGPTPRADPEDEVMMADAVGLALLVVLETLTPAERLAFVLYEMFGMPFEEIAALIGKSPAATRQLASRARRRVQGAPREANVARQREVVEAYLAALRAGDMDALLAILDPDVVIRADRAAVPDHLPTEVRGAQASAQQAMLLARGAMLARPALVDGAVGLIVAPRGRLKVALAIAVEDGKIKNIDVIADETRLRSVTLALLDDPA